MEYTKEMMTAIQDARDCSKICQESVVHCLEMGGRHSAATHILKLNDCAIVSDAAAALMISMSSLHTKQCAVCEETCNICAEGCEQFEDDKKMQTCANLCRQCAKSCSKIAEEI